MTTATGRKQRRGPDPAALGTVLVATDLSPGSAMAIARAARLPLGPRGRVVVAAVAAPGGASADDADLAERLRGAAVQLAAKISAAAPRARVETLLLHGQPHEQLAACAATARAELIVLGRHGHRPLADLFGLGTTADRLVRIADAPVLVACGQARRPYRRPLAALDHPLAPATRRAIRAGRRLIAPEVRWAGVHVAGDTQAALMRRHRFPTVEIEELRRSEAAQLRHRIGGELARAFPELRWTLRLERGDPRFLIPELAARHRADLIVVGARTRKTLDRRLLGTVAESVLRRARCDVLVAPAPGDAAGAG